LFLERYKKILKDGARISFKTDNIGLFEYSLETLREAGFTLYNVCYDLHASELNEENIMTEYERNFSAQGFKINYLEAILN
jgi:tRNA (guanine-N7-)-methyltransferase